MDFFSAARHSGQQSVPTDEYDVKDFAAAIAGRFDDSQLLTARLTPVAEVPQPLRQPSSPVAPSFHTIMPENLLEWLNDSKVLVLDIRPHAAHVQARIPNALSL